MEEFSGTPRDSFRYSDQSQLLHPFCLRKQFYAHYSLECPSIDSQERYLHCILTNQQSIQHNRYVQAIFVYMLVGGKFSTYRIFINSDTDRLYSYYG